MDHHRQNKRCLTGHPRLLASLPQIHHFNQSFSFYGCQHSHRSHHNSKQCSAHTRYFYTYLTYPSLNLCVLHDQHAHSLQANNHRHQLQIFISQVLESRFLFHSRNVLLKLNHFASSSQSVAFTYQVLFLFFSWSYSFPIPKFFTSIIISIVFFN